MSKYFSYLIYRKLLLDRIDLAGSFYSNGNYSYSDKVFISIGLRKIFIYMNLEFLKFNSSTIQKCNKLLSSNELSINLVRFKNHISNTHIIKILTIN